MYSYATHTICLLVYSLAISTIKIFGIGPLAHGYLSSISSLSLSAIKYGIFFLDPLWLLLHKFNYSTICRTLVFLSHISHLTNKKENDKRKSKMSILIPLVFHRPFLLLKGSNDKIDKFCFFSHTFLLVVCK